VSTLVTVALVIFFVSVVAGLVLAGLKGLDAWRAFKRFRRSTEAGMVHIAELIAQMEKRTAGVSERIARIERAQARLQESIATAGVIGGAAGELWSRYRVLRSFMPRK
jgi:hypothetical protein